MRYLECCWSEAKCLSLAKQGHGGAFDVLIRRYQSRVCQAIARYISEQHEVADLCQETFLKAYRSLPSFRGDSRFYTWLYRIAINTAKSYLVSGDCQYRRHHVISLNDENTVPEAPQLQAQESPELCLIRDETEQRLRQILKKLPQKLQRALVLREMEGYSYQRIAAVMQCPVGTVRSRLFRARETIFAKLI